MKKLLLISMLFFVFSNCNSTKTTQKEGNNTSEEGLKNGIYTVVELYKDSIPDSNPTISIDADKKSVSGFSGCNTYSCPYDKSEEKVTFQNPMASKMFCPKQAELEEKFFKALSETKNIKQEGDKISLFNQSGETIIVAKIQ